MGLTLVTPPAAEPVTLSEAKLHLRVDLSDDDALITRLIAAARRQVETRRGLALVTQAWRLTLDRFPIRSGAIVLPRVPVAEVTSITYVPDESTTTTLAASEYVLEQGPHAASVRLAYGKTWPATIVEAGAVTVEFTAGYGGAADVPDDLKAAMLLLVGDLYANRSAQEVGTIIARNETVTHILSGYGRLEAV